MKSCAERGFPFPRACARPSNRLTRQDRGRPAIRKIIEFQQLGEDWDGFGAKPPSRELLESAIALANVYYQKGVNPPQRVAPGVDGSVIFEWQGPDGTYTDVEIVQPFSAEVMMVEPGQPARHWTLPSE